MDAPYWLLATAIVVVPSAGVFAALLASTWADARLLASVRRRTQRGSHGQRRLRQIGSSLLEHGERFSAAWSHIPASRFVSSSQLGIGAAGALAGLSSGWILQSALLGAAGSITVLLWIAHAKRSKADSNVERLRAQLPHLFTSLASSVGAGLSLVQAFGRAAQTCEEPLASQLAEVNSALALGVPLLDALEQFSSRSRVPELRAVVVGLGVQHTAGGGLVRMLEHASYQLRQGEALRRSVRTHTAQGRMTLRMVTLVPIGLAVLMSFISNDYLSVFIGTPSGRALLGVAIALEAIGAFTVSRLLRVEV